jgi:hypothetical protein
VLGYGTPDAAPRSGSVDEHVQTLAMLGNLARMGNVAFSGDDGLGELATELQLRVPPHLRPAGPRGSVHLLPVDRDFSSATDVPEGTWMVAFGWHMHALYDLRDDFPYHSNIRPLFVSFHVNRLEMLTGEALAYLRRYGPVGCRDWTTVFLLLSAGVDAFFTGCLTTTLDAIFPARDAAYRGKGVVGAIDAPPGAVGGARNVRAYSHQPDEQGDLSLAGDLRAASERLAGYQRELSRAVTGRLHAYLALTSLGVPVEFADRGLGDVQHPGLTGLRPGDPRLAEMRDGIRGLIASTFERVLSGAPEGEVYARWRDLTRTLVAGPGPASRPRWSTRPPRLTSRRPKRAWRAAAFRPTPRLMSRYHDVDRLRPEPPAPAAVLVDRSLPTRPARAPVDLARPPTTTRRGSRRRSRPPDHLVPCDRSHAAPGRPAGSRAGSRSPRWTACCFRACSRTWTGSSTSTSTR